MNRSSENFPGVLALEVQNQKLYRDGFLKSGEDRKILHTSVETFVSCLANTIPPWAAYRTFMSGRLIALEKQPGVCLVRVVENWRRLLANIV